MVPLKETSQDCIKELLVQERKYILDGMNAFSIDPTDGDGTHDEDKYKLTSISEYDAYGNG